ncbi:MAG TPA: reductive dehalogenase domain-containing protein, partial [Anaerolineales bacterium]|nr:reductive dehalogenase domain-containing protein [Anaerolineales bacterium]
MAKRKPSLQEKAACEGELSRRDFLRTAVVAGATLGAVNIVSGCSPQTASGSPTATVQDVTGGRYLRMDDNNNRPTMPSDYKPAPTFTPQPEVDWIGRTVSTPTPRGSYTSVWYCGACGKQFVSLDLFLTHAANNHAWRLPEIRQVDKPTYEQFIVQPLERFDERNTVFSRTDLDAEYQTRRNAAPLKNIINPTQALEGQALLAGGIYVDNKAGTLHEKYYGYFAHVRGAGGLYDWDEPVNTTRYPVDDPVAMSTRVKEVARIYGADLVGITRLDQRWVYSDWFERATQKTGKLVVNKKYAIVLAIEMNGSLINQSPGLESSAEVALAYSRMAEVAASLAAYIRALGYAATPHGNDTTQSIPLAIDAGLG